jgi:hypothetical protein
MAIEPAGIIQAIKEINKDTPIEHYMQNIYAALPTCVQRAIATIQCTQLELDYKQQVARMQTEFNFDLHKHLQDQIQTILTRRR